MKGEIVSNKARTQILRRTQLLNAEAIQNELEGKKKGFDLQEFVNSFQSLDPQNIGGWPLPVKITIFGFVALMVMFLSWFLMLSPKMEEISQAQAQQETLLAQFKDKDNKVRNLKQYQKQVEDMNQTFNQLLSHLPKQTQVSDLVEDLNVTGEGSNLKIDDIKVGQEVENDLFYELPLEIKATGDYHGFGNFAAGISSLPRIVTVENFTITRPEGDKGNMAPMLQMVMEAKTYRLNEKGSSKTAKAATPAAGGAI